MTKQNDSLFLLEVLIDKIVFVKSPCFSDKDFKTCVNIESAGVEPLEICDDEPGACIAKSNGPFIKSFNNGKSCLFSLSENQIASALTKYPINVSVYKSLPCGCLPTKIVMGECTIDMTKEFVEARKTFLEDPSNVSYQALKDSFRIVGPDGSETGDIVMFLRISCFGKLIITRFQGPGGPPNIGAGKGSGVVDRSCMPKKDFQSMQDPCACGAARTFSSAGGKSAGPPCDVGGGSGVCPPARDPYDSMPCEDPDDPCFCSGPKPVPHQQMICRNTDQYCLHVPKDCCPPGNKIIFQLPTDTCDMNHKQRAHFNFTTDGIGDLTRDEPGQLMPPTSENYPGVTYDFSKQVIKLRIGKTVEMPGRKSKFEYQFITPAVTHEIVVPVREARTAQCLPTCSYHCPLDALCNNTPKELYFEKILDDRMKVMNNKRTMKNNSGILYSVKFDKTPTKIIKNLRYQSSVSSYSASNSILNQPSKKSTASLNKVHFAREYSSIVNLRNTNTGLFGKVEIPVYMTLSKNRHQTSATQATASINKCLQVYDNSANLDLYMNSINSEYSSTCTGSTLTYRNYAYHNMPQNLLNQEVYFFGRKKEEKQKGMGSKTSNSKLQKTNQSTSTARRNDVNKINSKSSVKSSSSTKVKNPISNVTVSKPKTNVPAKTSKGAATASGTSKSVTIKEDKEQKPCPALGTSKGDMMVTVSHIKIGPKETCPVHGSEPCHGPKCILASSGEEQGPVKVTTANNPRRGVFEIVIRKLTGAPLAKNELMLEWTPPPSPSRSPPCNTTCPIPYIYPGTCRHSKCKLRVCRPSSPCRPKCCKKLPCGQQPCRSIQCQKCCKSTCCGNPCKSCSTNPQKSPCCHSLPCNNPCNPPCTRPQCTVPCKSSPCLSLWPCPVGRKRVRKSRSQPKIKSHRKRISPCHNRTKACPVVRCRSVPGPYFPCCKVRPVCLPRKCCSVLPCKPPKTCVSSCSSSCG